jgi:hypothetical protein
VSLIEKSDVKNHLSTHNRNGIHLQHRASQPDATGFSGEQAGPADSNQSSTVEDTRNRSAADQQQNGPAKTGTDSSGIVMITDFKSARA